MKRRFILVSILLFILLEISYFFSNYSEQGLQAYINFFSSQKGYEPENLSEMIPIFPFAIIGIVPSFLVRNLFEIFFCGYDLTHLVDNYYCFDFLVNKNSLSFFIPYTVMCIGLTIVVHKLLTRNPLKRKKRNHINKMD